MNTFLILVHIQKATFTPCRYSKLVAQKLQIFRWYYVPKYIAFLSAIERNDQIHEIINSSSFITAHNKDHNSFISQAVDFIASLEGSTLDLH